ncbi:MAG: peptide deformylase [Candidatus Magasanikbacteria bacterium RIFCSPHIGHO2_01_FULL_41_23]|uniref:Peptide deformylase n=1 Tax=Candidatus Magasanikbacteria bacterium RIFCSPLOWO2_01_FULL_40_15 TaxID=1798686 RepID=A0A1F6N3T1_9BACT|nr:MAG: peptide deformylase [Candidatus Magasanikbacteria bacterium RIFCSPHIGHO2_01_FULL_41_23]OGH76601.1 MAG: peptide deformylase [Candidatus Magasanikbacteria bacterium RIFCSPHIGHO2_12_FULL_41_16]OGH78579.1 MAG: peptide deformylase [Candidatus Magasanikbacteria bacterium RIFCSPLOWO2_01_FULL_40_15]
MSELSLVILPAKTLREPSRELIRKEILASEMQQFLFAMVPTMYQNDGIGLAAPQVNRNIRACIIGKSAIDSLKRPEKSSETTTKKKQKKDLILINPVFQKISKKMTVDTEGCLSVPGFYGTVKRYQEIYVTALNEKAEPIEFAATGFFARVIQHEIDHLAGGLFIDRAYDLYQNEHAIKLDPKMVLQNIKEAKN